eukprot:g15196.t1
MASSSIGDYEWRRAALKIARQFTDEAKRTTGINFCRKTHICRVSVRFQDIPSDPKERPVTVTRSFRPFCFAGTGSNFTKANAEETAWQYALDLQQSLREKQGAHVARVVAARNNKRGGAGGGCALGKAEKLRDSEHGHRAGTGGEDEQLFDAGEQLAAVSRDRGRQQCNLSCRAGRCYQSSHARRPHAKPDNRTKGLFYGSRERIAEGNDSGKTCPARPDNLVLKAASLRAARGIRHEKRLHLEDALFRDGKQDAELPEAEPDDDAEPNCKDADEGADTTSDEDGSVLKLEFSDDNPLPLSDDRSDETPPLPEPDDELPPSSDATGSESPAEHDNRFGDGCSQKAAATEVTNGSFASAVGVFSKNHAQAQAQSVIHAGGTAVGSSVPCVAVLGEAAGGSAVCLTQAINNASAAAATSSSAAASTAGSCGEAPVVAEDVDEQPVVAEDVDVSWMFWEETEYILSQQKYEKNWHQLNGKYVWGEKDWGGADWVWDEAVDRYPWNGLIEEHRERNGTIAVTTRYPRPEPGDTSDESESESQAEGDHRQGLEPQEAFEDLVHWDSERLLWDADPFGVWPCDAGEWRRQPGGGWQLHRWRPTKVSCERLSKTDEAIATAENPCAFPGSASASRAANMKIQCRETEPNTRVPPEKIKPPPHEAGKSDLDLTPPTFVGFSRDELLAARARAQMAEKEGVPLGAAAEDWILYKPPPKMPTSIFPGLSRAERLWVKEMKKLSDVTSRGSRLAVAVEGTRATGKGQIASGRR